VRPLPVFVTESAAAAIREASDWWVQNRPAAPAALAEELEKAFALISVQPGIGARARNLALETVRRVHLARIHYHLYYRVSPSGNELEILAFWHTSRGSAPVIQEPP
jgi:plasmid stabilization system protein ParE